MTVGIGAVPAVLMAFVGGTVMMVCRVWLAVRLRQRHLEIWDVLGRPAVMSRSYSGTKPLQRYFRERRHLELGDDLLNRLARIERVAATVHALGVFAFLAVLLYSAWSAL